MSFSISSSNPYTQEWSSSWQRKWSGREGPVDSPVGPLNLDDMNTQLSLLSDLCHNRRDHTYVANELSQFRSDGNKFEIRLDVSHYSPEEFNVKIVDKDLVIECKHEEKKDEFGWISRQFTRKFALPEDVDIEKVHSTLSSTGVLTVEMPKKIFQTKEENVVYIPIIHEKDLSNGKEQTNSDVVSDGQQKSEKNVSEKTERTEVIIEVNNSH